MNYRKEQKKFYFFMCMFVALLTSCGNNNKFNFANSDEAITACQKEYYELSKKKSASIRELTRITNRWIALRDSSFSVMSNDTTIDVNNDKGKEFFTLTGNINTEILRIAMSEEHNFKDYLNLKLNTSYNRENILDSEEYSKALEFYDSFDESLYITMDEALKKYHQLMTMSTNIKTEGQLLKFIKEEDKCFRSIMKYLNKLPDKDLEELFTKTEEIFYNLYCTTSGNMWNSQNKRLTAYLSIRINRRVIQNAEACMNDIDAKKHLTEEKKNQYRWMLLQPFLSIDNNIMAYLTDKQYDQMKMLAKNLNEHLLFIDGKAMNKKQKEDYEHRLASFFIQSYLKDIL